MPLMTKRKICYADDDGEKMCYAMQKKRKKWWPLMIAKRLVSAVDDEEGAMLSSMRANMSILKFADEEGWIKRRTLSRHRQRQDKVEATAPAHLSQPTNATGLLW